MGKALAAGFPLAGILMKEEYDVLDYGFDEYTYGGHPISCAIALENIKFLTTSNILKQVKNNSKVFHLLLKQYQSNNMDKINDVRYCGLLAGIEFKSNKMAVSIYHSLLKQGLITRKSIDGVGSSLVLKPPIIVSQSIIKKAMPFLMSWKRNFLTK